MVSHRLKFTTRLQLVATYLIRGHFSESEFVVFRVYSMDRIGCFRAGLEKGADLSFRTLSVDPSVIKVVKFLPPSFPKI